MITAPVMLGRLVRGEIVCRPPPTMANVIVSIPAAPLASRMACRSDPAPESPVLLTTNVAAWALPARTVATANRQRPIDPTRNCICISCFGLLPGRWVCVGTMGREMTEVVHIVRRRFPSPREPAHKSAGTAGCAGCPRLGDRLRSIVLPRRLLGLAANHPPRDPTTALLLAHFIRTLRDMTRLLPDPELDRMVRELNEHEADAEAVSRSPWPAAQVPSGNPLEALLIEVARRGASDLLIIAGAPPVFRVGGHLLRGAGPPLSGDEVAALLDTFLTPRVRERIVDDGAVDFSLRLAP